MTYTLLTGGNGYIGSHIAIELYNTTTNIIILDNYSNSLLDNKKRLSNKLPKIIWIEGDILDKKILRHIFSTYSISNVIHLAGLKSISESIELPILYYSNNITGTLNLLEIMKEYKCYNIIFSSSATVYGFQKDVPIKEKTPINNNLDNAYAKSKLYVEKILLDLNKNSDLWNIIILRYFNPIGCHYSGITWENPKKTVQNLFPYIIKVYSKELPKLTIFGNNYNTRDGTCIRDFIHIMDLANAHIQSLKFIKDKNSCYEIFNIGTGKGYSVLEVVNTFNKYSNNSISYEYGSPREGDVPYIFSDCEKANKILNWYPKKTLDDMVKDTISCFEKQL